MATNTTKKPVKQSTKTAESKPQWPSNMPFKKINYILMAVGVLVLILGYILLSGGGSDDPSKFNNAIFDARRLKVAPITLIIGFIIELFAIMYRPKEKENPNTEETQA